MFEKIKEYIDTLDLKELSLKELECLTHIIAIIETAENLKELKTIQYVEE